MPSADRRRENAEAKRKKILDAAITLFQERGFDNVTIDEIVKKAGFSRGTFYKLFLGKEDLVVSYMGQWNASYADYYERELKDLECDAMEKIKRLVRYMLKASTMGGQSLQRIAISSGMHDKVLAEKISKNGTRITQILEGLLQEGMAQGRITRQYGSKELCRMIYVVLEGISLRWAGFYDEQPVEAAAGDSLELLFSLMENK